MPSDKAIWVVGCRELKGFWIEYGRRRQARLVLASLCVLYATFVAGIDRLSAQELEPLTLANTPTGINLFGAGLGFSQGNVLLDPSLPIENLDGDLLFGALRYLRTFGLLGSSAKFSALVPFTSGDWRGNFEGEASQRSATGFGDLRLTLRWAPYGAPALNQEEMRSYKEQTVIGGSVRVIVPTGEYDSSKLINLGSNRWSVRGEVGASRPLGGWKLEGFVGAWIYGKNDNFVGREQEQENMYIAKAHAIYSFRPGFWIGFGVGYGNGGRTVIDGIKRDNRQENWRFGATAAYPVSKQHGLSLTIGTAINHGAGGDYDTVSIGYQYAWGDI